MSPLDLLLVSLAIWYVSYCITQLPGPYNLFERLKTKGKLFTCIYCLSWWVAMVFALIWISPIQIIVYPFALAGAALMLHRYTGGNHV